MPWHIAFGADGVPIDPDHGLDPAWRIGLNVIFGEFEGNEFDWTRMEFKQRD